MVGKCAQSLVRIGTRFASRDTEQSLKDANERRNAVSCSAREPLAQELEVIAPLVILPLGVSREKSHSSLQLHANLWAMTRY